MFKPTRVLTTIALFLPFATIALPTAPAAWCYTDNDMSLPTIPDFGLGESSSDPNNISDGPHGWMQACYSSSAMKEITATIPEGYTASYATDTIFVTGISCR